MVVRRERVVAAAIRLLNDDPGASMAELAGAAGISRASLHRHFASRDDLLAELGERSLTLWRMAQDEAGIDAAAASGDPALIERALHELLARFVDGVEEHGFALTEHLIARVPGLAARGQQLERREIAFYEAARGAGVLRADLPAAWISSAVYGLLLAVRDCEKRGELGRAQSVRVVVDTFLFGTSKSQRKS